MTAVLLVMLTAALAGIACYNFICVGRDIPTGQTSKMMILVGRREGTRKENLGDVYIAKVADLFSRFIHPDPLKRAHLENALAIAGIKMTPENYIASAIARALLIILVTIPMWILSPLFVLVGIALGCLTGFMKYQEVLDYVAKRRKRIEAEIPRFASAITQGLEIDRGQRNRSRRHHQSTTTFFFKTKGFYINVSSTGKRVKKSEVPDPEEKSRAKVWKEEKSRQQAQKQH